MWNVASLHGVIWCLNTSEEERKREKSENRYWLDQPDVSYFPPHSVPDLHVQDRRENSWEIYTGQ